MIKVKPTCTLIFAVTNIVYYNCVSPTFPNSFMALCRGGTDGDSWLVVLLEDVILNVYRLLS